MSILILYTVILLNFNDLIDPKLSIENQELVAKTFKVNYILFHYSLSSIHF